MAGDLRVEIRGEDAVHFDFTGAARAAGRPLLVVGNLPYQITTALLFAIADAGAAIARSVVMVQREFAERVVAPPGSKTYGRLSVMIQQRMRVQRVFNVPPGAFFPRPRVVSSVMQIAGRAAAGPGARRGAVRAGGEGGLLDPPQCCAAAGRGVRRPHCRDRAADKAASREPVGPRSCRSPSWPPWRTA